ncbi:MAG: hypothetical protein QOD42_2120 [Sphingomonadales bacterium]|jgi:hypothetical protein|nr:hypothetical protein [Sphingomonadales bacterium]
MAKGTVVTRGNKGVPQVRKERRTRSARRIVQGKCLHDSVRPPDGPLYRRRTQGEGAGGGGGSIWLAVPGGT